MDDLNYEALKNTNRQNWTCSGIVTNTHRNLQYTNKTHQIIWNYQNRRVKNPVTVFQRFLVDLLLFLYIVTDIEGKYVLYNY